jgi:hypothetical protein
MSDEKKPVSRFKKGQSGNPSGRPKRDNSQMRDKLRQAMPEIVDKLIELAKGGDMQAIKVIMDKTTPNIKPIGAHVLINGLIPSDKPENQAQAVIAAMAGGLIDTSTGADMLSAIERLMKVREVSELTARIEQLELGLNSNGND